MTLHTIVPLENVLQGLDSTQYEYSDMEIAGVQMQVEPLGPNRARIVRLYHAPLHHYLNPELQPGQMIQFDPRLSSEQ